VSTQRWSRKPGEDCRADVPASLPVRQRAVSNVRPAPSCSAPAGNLARAAVRTMEDERRVDRRTHARDSPPSARKRRRHKLGRSPAPRLSGGEHAPTPAAQLLRDPRTRRRRIPTGPAVCPRRSRRVHVDHERFHGRAVRRPVTPWSVTQRGFQCRAWKTSGRPPVGVLLGRLLCRRGARQDFSLGPRLRARLRRRARLRKGGGHLAPARGIARTRMRWNADRQPWRSFPNTTGPASASAS
jgi:hypothetical protein